MHIGLLHPGEMGGFVGAMLQRGGHTVWWLPEGRSALTAARADHHGFQPAESLAALCAGCALIVSVCPPHAAEAVAQAVAAQRFAGLYVDANAIAPQRAQALQARLEAAGAGFVDGGIIGGPAWDGGCTDLYLAGPRAAEAAAILNSEALAARVLGAEVGQASALKLCYAALTKGTTALLAASLAAADAAGVREALLAQWDQGSPGQAEHNTQRVRRATAKAWRFVGEMEEIAAAFRALGLPGEFHTAAAEVFARLDEFKDQRGTPELDDVLKALRTAV
jgi:3-hydroxyisobutyrate dehydrogenase-like beta-hydroxyacid dehydrogenase